MKVQPRKIDSKERMRYLDALYTAIATLSSREEIKVFLRDLLTESERIMIGRRIIIAQRLLDGKTYNAITSELRVGIDTITRVHHWLEDESQGYETTLAKLQKQIDARRPQRSETAPALYSFEWLKKKYPLHFLLFNIFDSIGKKK